MKTEETVADTSAWVFVRVIVSNAVPPALMDETEKAFEMVGRAGVTKSVSEAEQTPATVQEPEALVLVTVAGGVIVAILVTWVWACASEFANRDRIRNSEAMTANPCTRRICPANLTTLKERKPPESSNELPSATVFQLHFVVKNPSGV